jgi:hypothetical protein
MQDKAKRQTYFENMSMTMATMCDTFATVMDKNVNDVLMSGIWGKLNSQPL